MPLDGKARIICPDCRGAKPAYCALRSWSIFEEPVRTALHHLKYRRDIGLGEALTPQLAESVAALHWPINLVVPVPLGRKRLAERGYNQVGLIARPLAMAMRIVYAPNALVRRQETRSQVGLTREQRQQNVRGAFHAKQSRVNERIVLLMDDVATTGSTLSSCAEALYAAGARDVFAFSVARALPRHGLRGA
jgi:ComF family protein